jgi:hypothetical protein
VIESVGFDHAGEAVFMKEGRLVAPGPTPITKRRAVVFTEKA